MVLAEEGYSQREIAKKAGCSRCIVEIWISRFERAKRQGVPDHIAILDKPRSGAPNKITKSIGQAILKFTEGKRNRQTPAIITHINNKFGVTLKKMSVTLWLHKQGLYPYHRPTRPRLLLHHKKKRLQFARKHKNDDWLNTLYTDEWEFPLDPKTAPNTKNDIVWARNRKDVPPVEVEQYSVAVRVWGGVSAKGKTRLIFYDGDLTAKKYRDEILKKVKPDFRNIFGARNNSWTFVHDGASAHKAKLTNEWLSENVPNHISSGPEGEWPAKSGDLNSPIEHAWGDMEGKLLQCRPKTIAALKRKLKKLWQELDDATVRRDAENVTNRLKSGGDWTEN